jgi:hypothetical protein
MSTDYGRWTVRQLKAELVLRQGRLTGRKSELIERLESYDKNDDFRDTVIQLPESLPMPQFPAITAFRTLTEADQGLMPQVRL